MLDISKLKPCGDKLLIKPDPIEEKTKAGIIKPQTRIADLRMARVVAISDGFWGNNGDWIVIGKQFQVGDRIAYQHGTAVPVEGAEDYSLVQMASIHAREKRGGEE